MGSSKKRHRGSREKSKSREMRRHGRSRSRESSDSSRSHTGRSERSSTSRSHERHRSRSRNSTSSRSSNKSYGSRRSTERRRSRSKGRNRRRSRSGSYDHRRSRSHGRSDSRSRKKHTKKRHLPKDHSPDAKTLKKIGAVKARMRSALDSLHDNEDDFLDVGPSTSNATTDLGLTIAETVSRHRDIERIEREGFHQSTFISTAGGAGGRLKTEDPTDRDTAIEKKEDTHNKAMFGPKWHDLIKKEENGEETTSDVIEIRKETPLAHPRFSEDPAVREERWLKIYRERRAKLLCL